MIEPPVTNADIIHLFQKALAVMEVENANPFRIRAYQNAIAAIQGLGEELSLVSKRGNLDKIPAIGPDLASKIQEILETGTAKEWEKLYKHVPAGMFELLDIPSIGPKRAFALAKAFKLDDPQTAIDDLRQAATTGKVSKLEGFGTKLESEILENLTRSKPKTSRMRLDEGDVIASKVLDLLKRIPEVTRADVLGSLRRREETVGDIDIGVATNNPQTVATALASFTDEILSVEATGSNMVRLLLPGNKQADIKFQTSKQYGATLQHFTGSKFHNIALREFALEQHKSLSEHGIKSNGTMTHFVDEEAFYQSLGLQYIPPELRQNTGEIQAAQRQALPQLLELNDIKGDFHTHTNFPMISSHDLGDSLDKLFTFASELSYEWLAIGDHNPSQTAYTPDEMVALMHKRNQFIDDAYTEWQHHTNNQLQLFKTMEVDILPNGSLPLIDTALETLDFVIVSIHSRMNLPIHEQTERIIKALMHPKVKILAHPTTRLIGDRQGIQVDWETVFATCLERHIAVEINANPHRLDLPDDLARQAKAAGLSLTLGSDAHTAESLQLLPYGVSVARRAWLEPHDIINTYSYQQVHSWLKS